MTMLLSSLRCLPLTPPSLPYHLSRRRNVPSLSLIDAAAAADAASSSPPPDHRFGLGVEDAFMGFISGRTKLTDLAHAVWRKYVGKGDVVVDATCGNGHDTLALLEMVADQESNRGRVYALDIQDSALASTSTLLDASVGRNHRQLVKLFMHCHSKMEDVLPTDTSARLIAFNLGYLPGGDKSIITTPNTTLPALQAATRLLVSGGIISVMVYVGHPGGMDELEVVKAFASSLSTDLWNCCRFENINRPAAPVLILLFKKP